MLGLGGLINLPEFVCLLWCCVLTTRFGGCGHFTFLFGWNFCIVVFLGLGFVVFLARSLDSFGCVVEHFVLLWFVVVCLVLGLFDSLLIDNLVLCELCVLCCIWAFDVFVGLYCTVRVV